MSTQITYTGEQELDVAGLKLTLCFEVTADVTYQPAVFGDLPEHCSPDESELDITEKHLVSVHDEDGNEVSFHEGTQHRLLAALNWESIEEKIWEEFHRQRHDIPDEDSDSYAED